MQQVRQEGLRGKEKYFNPWESMESFQKFGETLVPVLKKLGVDPGQPQVTRIHSVRNGS